MLEELSQCHAVAGDIGRRWSGREKLESSSGMWWAHDEFRTRRHLQSVQQPAFARADKQWHDKSRPLSVPFRSVSLGSRWRVVTGRKGETRGSTKQLKSGVRLKRACYDRARTFIIFLPDPRKRPAKFPRHPCPNSLVHCPARIPSPSSPSDQASLVEKFHCFCFLAASPAAINRPKLFQHATNRNWTFGEPSETCHPIHFVFRIWE